MPRQDKIRKKLIGGNACEGNLRGNQGGLGEPRCLSDSWKGERGYRLTGPGRSKKVWQGQWPMKRTEPKWPIRGGPQLPGMAYAHWLLRLGKAMGKGSLSVNVVMDFRARELEPLLSYTALSCLGWQWSVLQKSLMRVTRQSWIWVMMGIGIKIFRNLRQLSV